MKTSHEKVFTVGIGGAAGDGVRESGVTLGNILAELGYECYFSFTYPSLIRGGHNFARISFSKEKIGSQMEHIKNISNICTDLINNHIKSCMFKAA